ncbi:hypothetical protein AN640_01290 [Candidatus Epulonipiscium fishelsonii]|uniref:Uncharacterized protein n=1 Tax=Candidatus Epulonipiscium fishelsonii TaxID=77094 RepID=A0ACC8XGA2_9FIRM|nr:hypothetical protein AN640_01290 [Epulopiscium sp. SCG-D08WGA-EpuloA1]
MILKAKRILIGKNLEVLNNGAIVIENNIIKDIIKNIHYSKEETQIIDFGDATILPGLIDLHNHISLDAREYNHLDAMADPKEILLERGIRNMKDDLYAGVTTSRCLGEKHFVDHIIKQMIETGEIVGPRIITASIGMRSSSGHGYVGEGMEGKEQFEKTAKENINRGAEVLKLFLTPGIVDKDETIPCNLSDEEISAVVDVALSNNVPVTAHCIGGLGLIRAVEKGVNIIEHAYFATEEEIKCMKQHNISVCLTSGIILDETREPFCPPSFVEKVHRTREYSRQCMSNIVKSGLKFTLGTDAYHTYLYKEVLYAQGLGSSKLDALKAVTSNGAEMLGKQNTLGQIEKNYLADIIAVKGDLMADLSRLKDVIFVMKDGTIY